MTFKVRKLSYALGAEITGFDFSTPMNKETFGEIHRAFLEYCVLVFRRQPISREQLVAFSRWFGELEDNSKRRSAVAGFPELCALINKPKPESSPLDWHIGGDDWHADSSSKIRPTGISLLHAVHIPDVGGDTQFANMYLAYETLSEGMKSLVETLEAVHIQEEKLLDHSSAERLEMSRRQRTVAHRLVQVHPETGRKSIYIGDKVQLFVGMTREESRPLIDFLQKHSTRPQFVYRHVWQQDDLLVWDNRCTNHIALADYDRRNQLRHMEKTTVPCPPMGYLYDDPTHTRNLGRSLAM